MFYVKRFLLALLLTAIAVPAFAQWNNTGSLQLEGNMPVITELKVEDAGATLDLSQSETDVLVASVFERSNAVAGYTVSMTSTNDGELAHDGEGSGLSYTLSYGSDEVDLTAGSVTVTSSTSRTPAAGDEKEVLVSHGSGGADGEFLADGTYQDTLTFEIVAQ